ncbi:MAG: SDR family oxidoreductase [Bdellovibrionales bacterium]|nr:SDR family oxidoreductase [Bdellovibrionales bacterium]
MKTIVITGCTSGFGLETSRRLLAQGHQLIGIARGGKARWMELLGPEASATGRALAYDADLAEAKTVEDAARKILAENPTVDVLINNAGIGLMGTAEDQDPEELRRQFEINFFSAVRLTQIFLPALRKSRGRIISVSSICGIATFPFYGAYCSSKYALESYMEALRHDLAGSGVQVGLIEPGTFRTEFAGRNFWLGKRSRDPSSPHFARTQAFEGFVTRKRLSAPDPDWVVRTMVNWVNQPKIPVRLLIGWDAKFLGFLKKLLPTQLLFDLTQKGFRAMTRS